MRDEQRARLRIDEGARQPRQRLRAFRAAGRRVARRQDHPVGIELQARDLGGGEIAVVVLARRVGRRQDQARLGCPSNLPASAPWVAKCTMRYWASCAAGAQALHLALGGARAKPDLVRIGLQVARDGAQLVGRLGQRRLHAEMCDIGKPAARLDRRHAAAPAEEAPRRVARPSSGSLVVAGELRASLRADTSDRPVAVEQRIAEADHRLGGGARRGRRGAAPSARRRPAAR